MQERVVAEDPVRERVVGRRRPAGRTGRSPPRARRSTSMRDALADALGELGRRLAREGEAEDLGGVRRGRFASSQSTRMAIVSVLPLPAPATTRAGPSGASMIAALLRRSAPAVRSRSRDLQRADSSRPLGAASRSPALSHRTTSGTRSEHRPGTGWTPNRTSGSTGPWNVAPPPCPPPPPRAGRGTRSAASSSSAACATQRVAASLRLLPDVQQAAPPVAALRLDARHDARADRELVDAELRVRRRSPAADGRGGPGLQVDDAHAPVAVALDPVDGAARERPADARTRTGSRRRRARVPSRSRSAR